MSKDIDLRGLTYEELRMPMKDMEARNKEIKRRVKEEHKNPPIGLTCSFCGFEPCTMTEAMHHVMEKHPKKHGIQEGVMSLLNVESSDKAGNVIKLNFKGNDLSSLCVVFPGISGEAIEIRPEGIYIALDDKKLFISFCEPEPIFS